MQNAVKVTESKAEEAHLPSNTTGIKIEPDTDYRVRADIKTLNKVLQLIETPKEVKYLSIDYDSKLTKLPEITIFPNIEMIYLGCRKVKEYSQLASLKCLKDVTVCNFPYEDLRIFEKNSLSRLQILRGKLLKFDVSADLVGVADCSNLSEFSDIRVRKLEIDACKRLNLDSLENIKNLQQLTLRSQKEIQNFNFLKYLPDLKDLVVTANNLSKTDISKLYETKVPFIFLGVKDSLIRDIAESNSSIVITNGSLTYNKGIKASSNLDYYNGIKEIT